MDSRRFFNQLALVTALTAGILAVLLGVFEPARMHLGFSIGAVVLFVAICVALFFIGKNLAHSKNKLAFNSLITVSVFGKMMVSFALLLLYRSIAKPENQYFVLIFFLVYVVYTVFEVVFMTRLAKA